MEMNPVPLCSRFRHRPQGTVAHILEAHSDV